MEWDEVAPSWRYVTEMKRSQNESGGGGHDWVLSCQTKWSKWWRGWGDFGQVLLVNCKIAKWVNILQDILTRNIRLRWKFSKVMIHMLRTQQLKSHNSTGSSAKGFWINIGKYSITPMYKDILGCMYYKL